MPADVPNDLVSSEVMYTAEGWLDRNNDTVSEEKLFWVIAEQLRNWCS